MHYIVLGLIFTGAFLLIRMYIRSTKNLHNKPWLHEDQGLPSETYFQDMKRRIKRNKNL